jgi:hypothetical protein
MMIMSSRSSLRERRSTTCLSKPITVEEAGSGAVSEAGVVESPSTSAANASVGANGNQSRLQGRPRYLRN